MGLAGAVLVAASPGGPVQPVGTVLPGWRDDGDAREPQQLRDGDRDPPGVKVNSPPGHPDGDQPGQRDRLGCPAPVLGCPAPVVDSVPV